MQPHVRMLEQEGAHRLKWAQQDSEPLAPSESETRRFPIDCWGDFRATHDGWSGSRQGAFGVS